MKYIVMSAAVLQFPDGGKVILEPGVQDVPDDVAAHWAFSEYARPLTESDVAESQRQKTMAERIAALEAEIAEKDKLIAELQEQNAAGAKNANKGGDNAKKQQTSDS